MEYKYLNRIDSPADLKQIPIDELPEVCAELRNFIISELPHEGNQSEHRHHSYIQIEYPQSEECSEQAQAAHSEGENRE